MISTKTEERPRVLCVDDEPNVLEGLRLHLERPWRLSTASSGAEGLALLESEGPCAVVISDMRMPQMDGAAFLGRVRQGFPDTVRMLLTGHAEVSAAISAVNEGQIFRFLTKPCPPNHLLAAVRAAADQYKLVTAERVLLEQTLHGSVKALTDVLSLTHPLAFGRAMRIRQFVADLAERIGMKERWQVEIAAMLSQIGCVTLPPETVEKLHYGQDLSAEEQRQVSQLPVIAERLLGNIPRLEVVRAILTNSGDGRRTAPPPTADGELALKGAQMMRIASDCDMLETRGLSLPAVFDTMRSRGDRYDAALLTAFAEMRGASVDKHEVKELPLRSVRVGMVLVEDLYMKSGMLMAARGYEVTPGFVERAQNSLRGTVREPVRVMIRQ